MIYLDSLGFYFLCGGSAEGFYVFVGICNCRDLLLFRDFEAKEIHENMVRADALLHLLLTFIFLGSRRGRFLASEEGVHPVEAAHAKCRQDDEHE